MNGKFEPHSISVPPGALDGLTPRQCLFIKHYMALGGGTGCGAEAIRRAGYSQKYANSAANRMLHEPAIIAALGKIRECMSQDLSYDLRAFMTELDTGLDFAYTTKNAAAYSKLLELRGKAFGLLIERNINENVDVNEIHQQAISKIINGRTRVENAKRELASKPRAILAAE